LSKCLFQRQPLVGCSTCADREGEREDRSKIRVDRESAATPACGIIRMAWSSELAKPPASMKPVNSVLSRYGTTVFTAMSALALEHGAVNLGQGFPDEEGPEAMRRAAAETVLAGPNQ
jgi:hypothetical protein